MTPDDHVTPLLDSYRDTASASFVPPPPAAIIEQARRRGRARTTILAAAAATVVAAGTATMLVRQGPAAHQPAGPSPASATPAEPSPPPTPAPAPADIDITRVDWSQASVTFPDDPSCPPGRVMVRPTTGPGLAFGGDEATFGDLTGDGQPEAVVSVTCSPPEGQPAQEGGQLLVVTVRNGKLVGLGYVTTIDGPRPGVTIGDGQLIVEGHDKQVYVWTDGRLSRRRTPLPQSSGR